MMNDIDEDEISKKAFTTLTSMGEIAIDVVLGHIAALSIGISECVGLGEGLSLADGAAKPSKDIVEAVESVATHAKTYYIGMSEDTIRNRRRRDEEERQGNGGNEQSKASDWDVNDAGMTETNASTSSTITNGTASLESSEGGSQHEGNATRDGTINSSNNNNTNTHHATGTSNIARTHRFTPVGRYTSTLHRCRVHFQHIHRDCHSWYLLCAHRYCWSPFFFFSTLHNTNNTDTTNTTNISSQRGRINDGKVDGLDLEHQCWIEIHHRGGMLAKVDRVGEQQRW